jgi:YVTN family beta-propeller protein
MDNRQWREFMDAAMGVPPGRVTVAAVRRRLVSRRIREAAGVLAAVVVAVIGVTAAVRVFGAAPGPAAPHRSAAPTVYVAYAKGGGETPPLKPPPVAIIPISTATDRAGKPIKVGSGDQIAITPDGKSAYVLNSDAGTVTPINTATNTAGRPIHIGRTRDFGPEFIAITPDGKTAYVANTGLNTVTPISTATNTAGNPIKIPADPTFGSAYAGQPAITPDGKTAYVVSNHTHSVIPISTATNTAGQPIRFGSDCHAQPLVWPGLSIAITPDGKTAYFACESAVVPINTATNTAGNPIPIPLRDPITIAITP